MEDPTGFANPTDIKWSGHTGVVEYGGGDRGQLAMFYNKSVHHPAKSQAEGRPVFEDVVYVRIHPPGERLNIVDRPANSSDSRRWPMQWAQFQQNKQQTPEGTPIDLLYPDHPSIGATLRANGVLTVEQCADLSAAAIDSIGMGSQRYCNDAKKYLELANKGVKASQLRHELEERDQQIRLLTQQVDMLKNELAKMQENASNGMSPQQVQAMLAGMLQRPVHMPQQSFDPQQAMINATHKTSDIAKQQASPRKRARSKIG